MTPEGTTLPPHDAFEDRAHQMWAEIPDHFKEGIDGVVVRPEVEAHPDHDDYVTLGMCFTEPYPSSYMGPDSTRSIVAIYYGSFRTLAERHPDFDWEDELWETITHELRHHLEFLAEDEALEGLDYAMEETWKRGQGESFDPWYFEQGLALAPGIHRVEYDVYIVQHWRRDRFERKRDAGESLEFEWDGRRWAMPFPEELGDIHYLWLNGVEAGGGWVQLVLVRDRPLMERLKGWFRKEPLDLIESEAEPRVIGDAPDSPDASDGAPGRAAGGPPGERADE